jgi:integrase
MRDLRRAAEDEVLVRSIAEQFTEAGIEYDMPYPLDPRAPAFGLSNRQLMKRADHLADWLPLMRGALSRGDISMVSEAMTDLLDRAHLNLDPASAAYRKLGLAVPRADVRAQEALERRYRGEPIETPPIANEEPLADASLLPAAPVEASAALGANTLRAAFEGWQKERDRNSSTVAEYERALELFTQLHGELLVADITKRHALQFREALQDMPSSRSKGLQGLTLPQLLEWRQSHPETPHLTAGSINKLLGGVQAIAKWANKNGLVPDDIRWADPFAEMRLAQSDEEGGGPFEPHELQRLFASPVFTEGERPKGGQGDTAFWLPLLALFTGARRSELTTRKAADVSQDIATGHWTLAIHGKLKTRGSARTLPIHPALIRLGLLEFVKAQGGGWLFPAVATTKAANAWSNWWGRYLDKLGLAGQRRGLHSLRHGFKDALRAADTPEDLNDALCGHSNGSVSRSYGAVLDTRARAQGDCAAVWDAQTGTGHQRSAVPHHQIRGRALAAVRQKRLPTPRR